MPNVIGHVAICRWRNHGLKALCRFGQIHFTDEQLLPALPLQARRSVGDEACPFTTLYWDFLLKHEAMLAKNQRMVMQVRNLIRMKTEKKNAIHQAAAQHRASLRKGSY